MVKPKFICNCTKVFPSLQSLHRHERRVHEKKKFKCQFCSRELSSVMSQRAHMWICEKENIPPKPVETKPIAKQVAKPIMQAAPSTTYRESSLMNSSFIKF